LTTKDIILDAVRDLHAREQIVTREILAEYTNLALSIIDDRLGYLVDNGFVSRVQRGVYIPRMPYKPARPISRTITPDDGMTVLEIGDTVLVLTPRESSILGELMNGSAQSGALVEMGHQFSKVSSDLSRRIDLVQRKVTLSKADCQTLDMFLSETDGATVKDQ
jgi:hypothetical protein